MQNRKSVKFKFNFMFHFFLCLWALVRKVIYVTVQVNISICIRVEAKILATVVVGNVSVKIYKCSNFLTVNFSQKMPNLLATCEKGQFLWEYLDDRRFRQIFAKIFVFVKICAKISAKYLLTRKFSPKMCKKWTNVPGSKKMLLLFFPKNLNYFWKIVLCVLL